MVGFGKPDRAVSMRSYETGVDKGDYPSMEGDGEDVLPVDGVREPRTPGRGPDEGRTRREPDWAGPSCSSKTQHERSHELS